uniref:Uncharacterized protein n=1 Tax=Rhinopithecus roxellana TaxID=61622 RepID=A0A2K6NP98_RHIRO
MFHLVTHHPLPGLSRPVCQLVKVEEEYQLWPRILKKKAHSVLLASQWEWPGLQLDPCHQYLQTPGISLDQATHCLKFSNT